MKIKIDLNNFLHIFHHFDDVLDLFYSSTNNSLFLEKLLGIFLFLITILLGLDSDAENEKLYKKKYIIMVYTSIILINLIFRIPYTLENSIFLMLFIIFLTIISALNIGYKFDKLEKELNYIELLNFSFWTWFFKAKTYIFIFLISVLFLIEKNLNVIFFKDSTLTYGKEIINLIVIIICLLIHLVIDVKDTFDFEGFEKMYKKLENIRKNMLKTQYENITLDDVLEIDKGCEDFNISELLGLLLYIEDRDYLARKSFTYSLYRVLRRKIIDEKVFKKLKYGIKDKKNKFIYNLKKESGNKKKLLYVCNGIIDNLKQVLFKIQNLFSNLLRGYSTIEQQVVRVTVMKAYTYDYTFRRKLFIERIYLKAFIRAYKRRKIKHRNLKINLLNCFKIRGNKKYKLERNKIKNIKTLNKEIKLEFLIYYYIEVCNSPKNIISLLESIERESAQDMNSLNNKSENYKKSKFKAYIEKDLLKSYGQVNTGRYKMKKNRFYYEENLKEIYIEDKNNNLIKLEEMTSRPKEYNGKIAYIHPFDFETQNNIYIYYFIDDKIEKIYKWESQKCPKDLEWYDNQKIYLILGPTYGTVDIGGDLYTLNIETKDLKLIKKFPEHIQINKIKINNGEIKLEGIKYVDKNMIKNEVYKEMLKID